jgi:carbonic anhydrase
VSHLTDEEIRQFAISKNPDAAADVNKMEFGLWREEQLEETIREDVRKLRAEKSLKGMEVYGFSLETFTGAVTEVEV